MVNSSMTKGVKIYNEEKTVFSTNAARTTGQPLVKKEINLNLNLTPYTKINSK